MAIVLGVVLLTLALAVALTLAAVAMRVPPPPTHPVAFAPLPPTPRAPSAPTVPTAPAPEPGRVRLASRLLFARRTADAITLDCTLLRVEGRLPASVDPPVGLPFTLRVRCPDTGWFAGRVEELLMEWADDNRELVLELSPDRGKVRTTIASGTSSVHLELAGAAGLGSGLSSS